MTTKEKMEPAFSAFRFDVRPLSKEEGGGYLASIPDLPGCSGDGETINDAIADLAGAFESWVATAKEMGREIPRPGAPAKPVPALIRFPRTLHQELTYAAQQEGTSFNQYVVTTLSAAIAARAAGRSPWTTLYAGGGFAINLVPGATWGGSIDAPTPPVVTTRPWMGTPKTSAIQGGGTTVVDLSNLPYPRFGRA